MKEIEKLSRDARALMNAECRGILSTHSVAMPGYPFGSVLPFCLDRAGLPIIYISGIAQHTHNLKADPRLSLIVADRKAEDVQASARLTLLADAELIVADRQDAAERYYRYFPSARQYQQTHDFEFYRLHVKRARYIGGFGEIHWLDADSLLANNPFSASEETRIVEHMNEDHLEAMRHYCVCAGLASAAIDEPMMAGADGEGFHLHLGARLYRFEFPFAVNDVMQARQALVEMARREC